MDDVLRETDVVIRGVVGEPEAFLSEDKRNVYSAYPISNPIILYWTDLGTFPRSGGLPTVRVDILGGTIRLNGVTFRQIEGGLRPLHPGTDVLLLLKREKDRYGLVGTFWGAFAISAGTLAPLTTREGFAPEYRGAPAAEATQQILMRLKAVRR